MTLIDDVYTDHGGDGFAYITGLDGATLILAGNIGHTDHIDWPKGQSLPGRGWTWAISGGMALGFVSNHNYQQLPYGVKCPAGDQHGPLCIDFHHRVLHTCFGVEDDPYFEANVYIFRAQNGTHAGLPNLPSSVNG